MKQKVLIFDLDNTICESRQPITKEMKKTLSGLDNIIVISGASVQRIEKQVKGLKCIKMGQNGNDTPDWQNRLNRKEVKEILNHIYKIYPYFPDDCIQNRGCQMSLSFIGHSAEIQKKNKFDPRKKLRLSILKKIPLKSKTLIARVAGTTCIDYNRKGFLKGDNIKRYLKLHNINPKDCVYFGDAFFKGGNDESVKGIIKTVEVSNPQDLLVKLKKYV